MKKRRSEARENEKPGGKRHTKKTAGGQTKNRPQKTKRKRNKYEE